MSGRLWRCLLTLLQVILASHIGFWLTVQARWRTWCGLMEAAECSTWAQKTNIRKFVCIFLSKELWNLHMFHFSWSLRHQNELIRRLWLVSIARLEWNSLFCFRDFALGGNIWKSFQKYMFTCSACLSNVEVFHINKIWLFSVCSSIIANSEPHVSENYKIYAVPLICCKSGQLMFNSSELYLLICFYRNTGHFLVSQVFFF